MTRRARTFLLLAACGILAVAVLSMAWRATKLEPDTARSRAARPHAQGKKNASARPPAMVDDAAVGASRLIVPAGRAATRAEAMTLVTALYRREQLTRELDLEQRLHGGRYWQAGPGGRELAAVQTARAALLVELNAEANRLLAELFPDETSAPVALAPIFDLERPGPAVAFLSKAARAAFEDAILEADADRVSDPAAWLDLAAQVLPPAELEVYRRWNAPAAVALREQLAGFQPSEAEFAAILRRGAPDSDLSAELGSARYGELLKWQDPAMDTVRRELRRLDLPLEAADWMATTRAQAILSIQQIWQSAVIPEPEKLAHVARIERDYGRVVAARFSLAASSLDGLALAP